MTINKTSSTKLPKIIEFLKKEGNSSPNQIAKYIKSDKRALAKMLYSLEKLKLVKIRKYKIGKRVYYEVKLKNQKGGKK